MNKLLLLLSLFVASANASIVTYTDQAAWLAATGTTSLYDFNSDANGSFTSKDFGPFEAELINGSSSPAISSGELMLQNYNYASELKVTFDSSLSAFGFDWRNTDPTGDQMELTILGQSFVFGPSQSSGFFGLTSTVLFDSLGFSDSVGNGGVLSYGYLDNFRTANAVSAVPVPAALLMFGPALLGFFGLRRKANA
ncbi:hypothetical protein A9Q80_04110 [Cycloclasticus sp. 46_83_sub15_T18]|nr:hypothetical protein A9Q80_04110 [Cycloclasticus sp. 46_83_sub15_T18]